MDDVGGGGMVVKKNLCEGHTSTRSKLGGLHVLRYNYLHKHNKVEVPHTAVRKYKFYSVFANLLSFFSSSNLRLDNIQKGSEYITILLSLPAPSLSVTNNHAQKK